MSKLLQFKILQKILTLLSLLALVSLGATVFATGKMRYIDDTYGDLIDGPGRANLAIARANRNLVYLNRSIYRLITEVTEDRSKSATKEINDSKEFFNKQIKTAVGAMPSKKAEIEQIGAKVNLALDGVCAETINLANSTKLEDKNRAATHMHETCDPVLNEAMDEIAILTNQILKVNDKASDEAQAVTNATIRNSYILILGGLAIVMLIVATLVVRWITSPLSRLIHGMKELADGNFGVVLPGLRRKDEVGEMAQAVEMFKIKAGQKARDEAEVQKVGQDLLMRRQEEIDQLIGFFGRSMSGSFKSLSVTSADMSRTSTSLETAAQTTGSQATSVLSEVGQTSINIQTVAAASQQLSASIFEIGRQAGESARGSAEAMQQAEAVVAKVNELRQAADQIGNVVKLINTIASQTNLLALNATIEAARAGESGRGFAVVAGEVKALAEQTAKATSDIAQQVASIQSATSGAAEAIQEITGTIRGVNDTAVAIATAVEHQGAATREIARSIESVTVNAASMTRSMERVQGAVEATSGSATEVKRTTEALSADTGFLSSEVQEFLGALRELGESRQLRKLDVDLKATAIAGGQSFAGRVLKISPGMALFDGPLQVVSGTQLELHIDGLERPLRGRFVDRIAAGCQIQLLLNHEHLSFMEAAITRLSAAA
jgi:methyl-accepting chemotaxis protein